MDKRELIKKLETKVAADMSVLTQAAIAAHEAATHAESKAEDQYDTRGLEASYLAGAQSKRAMELQQILDLYRYIDLKTFGPQTPIAATAIVEVESDGKRSFYFLMPKGGGMSAEIEGKIIHVVTPQAPMGEALLGRRVGDQIEVAIQNSLRDYDVVAVW